MRFIRILLSALAAVSIMGITSAAEVAPVLGQDYMALVPAQSTEAGKKVEVIEFFAYYCPHCLALESPLSAWVKKQGDKIVFKRVHVSYNGEPMAQQKLYYTLESMGKADEYQSKVFFAMHFQHHRFAEDSEIIDYMVNDLGMDRGKFTSVYNSTAVQEKVDHALQLMGSYQIQSWPEIVIDGKFTTSPTIAGKRMPVYEESGAHTLMLKVLDALVDMQSRERAKK